MPRSKVTRTSKEQALRALAEQARELRANPPRHHDAGKMLLKQWEMLGRLLAEAHDKGAFAWSEILRDCRELTLDQPGRGYTDFWIFARQDWMGIQNPHAAIAGSSESPPLDYAFKDDCRMLADMLDVEADAAAPTVIAGKKRNRTRTSYLRPLTARQNEAIELFGIHHGKIGLIAAAMNLKHSTVIQHLTAAWRKMGHDARSLMPTRGKHRTQRLPHDQRGSVAI